MPNLLKSIFFVLGLGFWATYSVQPCFAIEDPAKVLPEIGIATVLGKQLDSGLKLVDSSGSTVSLAEIQKAGKPAIMVPVYYECPRSCGLVLNGVTALLNKLDLKLGTDFDVLTISFDTEEGPELAAKRQFEYRNKLEAQAQNEGWRFFVGLNDQIQLLMQQLGFLYKRDGAEFVHASAIMILTPQGLISQYFTGIDYPSFDVKLALVEASQGRIGSSFDHLLLYCFRFDPTKGKYTWAAFNLMRTSGVLTMAGLVGLLGWLFVGERRKRASSQL